MWDLLYYVVCLFGLVCVCVVLACYVVYCDAFCFGWFGVVLYASACAFVLGLNLCWCLLVCCR